MFASIVKFEVRYQLRSPVFVIGAALFFLLTFLSVTVDTVQIGARGNVNVNSPAALCQTIAIMTIFALFVICSCVSNVVLRDDETRFAPLIRATRVSKFDYLNGRFVGAMLIAFLTMLAVPLALFLGSLMPWLDPDKVGPFVALHYLYSYGLFAVLPLIVMGAVLFSLATVTRSMMWAYVALIGLLVMYFATRVLLRDPRFDTIAVITDPFGLSWFFQATRYWTTSDRNTLLPPMSNIALASRAMWLGIAAVFYGIAYTRFRFDEKGGSEARATPDSASSAAVPAPVPRTTHAPAMGTTPGAAWKQLGVLTRFDLRYVFRSPALFVLLGLAGLNALGGLFGTVYFGGVAYLPVTRAVIDSLNGSFVGLAVVIVIYYSGELVWRDHDRRIAEIVGATPAPDWTFLLPKVLAITLVMLASFLVAMVVSIVFQLARGYTHLEIGNYLLWFILPNLIAAFQMAALSIMVQVLVPHKFIGWAVMLVYIVASLASAGAGFEHHLYDFAGNSPVPMSDMNGLGRFWIGRAWFQVYWTGASLVMLLVAYAMWRRGSDVRFAARARRLARLTRGTPAALLAASVIAFVGCGAFIFYNTNILNPYETVEDHEQYLADYERAVLPFESLPQPRITDVKLNVELYPHEVRAVTHGEYIIENRTQAPLEHVHVRWSRPLQMTQLEIEGGHLARDFGKFDYQIYDFAVPMQPGEKRTIKFATLLEQKGFPNERPLTRIVANGTFVDNSRVAPGLGVDRSDLLTSRVKRRKYGLEPADLRPPKLEDASADAVNYLRHDSDWVNADLTVSTDADQTPIAPGYTLSDSTADGRRTVHTHTEAPILNYFSMQSARYAEAHDEWRAEGFEPVALTIYYQPGHEANISRMLLAMKNSLDVYTKEFGPFQFRQMRIIEFPDYEQFAESFANTVPFSEGIGFIEDFDPRPEAAGEQVDLVTYVTAHEIGHQWWAHQVIGADKQGMTMLSESFAQYSALLVMERMYGPAMLRKFTKHELDSYLRGRGADAVEELPLERVENQPYIHYRKGSLVMYWLRELVGEETVNSALRKLLVQYKFKGAPYPSSTDFIALLKQEAGPQYDAAIDDLFARITLYDMKASAATAHQRPDGKYDVTFTVDGRKMYADGQGKETDAPLSEIFELGAFTVEPGHKGFKPDDVIQVERRTIETGKTQITMVVDREPHFVGVDPYNKRIDRNSADNVTTVNLAP